MVLLIRKYLLILFLCCFQFIFSQLVTPACVHAGGVQFILDAYLASMGACNCQRSGVLLTEFKKCENGAFVLDFEDNFDGDSLDRSKWETPGEAGALLNDQNVGIYNLDNAIVNNGVCHLTAKKETVLKRAVSYKPDFEILQDGLPNLRKFDYTSGMIRSKKEFLYGKFEIRCRMPVGQGFWPAYWFFGGKRWNEVDVFDNYAGLNEFVNSIGHDFEGRNKPNACNAFYKGFDFSNWHTFTCIIDYDKITTLIDNHVIREIYRVFSSTNKPVLCGDEINYGSYFELEAFPMEEMKLILNLALIANNQKGGGNGFKSVDESTPFPSSFDIDYVKAWKRRPFEINIYPNPTSGLIKIKSNLNINKLKVFDSFGALLITIEMNNNSAEIDLNSLSNGIYFINYELNGILKWSKILKL